MDLKNSTTEQLLSLLKRRNVPQEALDLLRDNGIDGSTLLQPIDDIDEFMAVVPKSGHRLLIKRIIKEELARADLHVEAQETYPMKRKFITEEANSSKEILDMCPYLGKSYHVRSEMRRILEDACVAGAEDCLVRGLRVILNQGGDNLTNADVVDVVKIIQQRTKKKSSNQEVFKFQDPTTPPHKLFKDKRVEFSLLCIGSCQEVDQVFVCGED